MLGMLRALDFRCWGSLALDVSAEGGIFVGNNAQGKTSILEAVCVLLRLQSPRTHKFGAMTRFSSAGFGVSAEMNGCLRKVRHVGGALVCEVDGELRATGADFLRDSGLVVWMGNEDVELIRGGGEQRRRYLDFIGSQWDLEYRAHWARYRRAVKMKSSLLKFPVPDEKQIAAWEEVMIESGSVLGAVRQRMIAKLVVAVSRNHGAVGGGGELIEVGYRRSGREDLRAGLREAQGRERRLRQCVVGPHRDDIVLQINGLSAAEFASEGQQRTLALALKLAQGEMLAAQRGVSPVYLIDDVFGELDPLRRNALMAALPVGAQKWITTTHVDWWREREGYAALPRFTVAGGKVAKNGAT